MKSCDGCQKSKPPPPYRKTQNISLTNIFEPYSIGFCEPLLKTKTGKEHLLIAENNLIGLLIAIDSAKMPSKTVMRVIEKEFIYLFNPLGLLQPEMPDDSNRPLSHNSCRSTE